MNVYTARCPAKSKGIQCSLKKGHKGKHKYVTPMVTLPWHKR